MSSSTLINSPETEPTASQPLEPIRRIDAAVLNGWLQSRPGEPALTVLDVREPNELVSGGIPNALHTALGNLIRSGNLPISVHSRVVVYCESGVRSLRAAQKLMELGYEDVWSLNGGFAAWKRENYPVQMPEAAPGAHLLSAEQYERYSRHLRLPQMSEVMQRRLLDSKVLIVGVGGLGTPAAQYLAAAGVGTVGLLDNDNVELSNLQRQILHSTSRIGQPKVESAAQALTDLNRDVTTKKIQARLSASNIQEIFAEGWHAVIDGSDNYATRYLLNDVCSALGIPVVFGSVQGFEGRVMTVVPGHGPCYRCAFPAPPPEELACSCDAAGVLGVLPGVIGVLQATEAIKVLTQMGEPLIGRMLHYDALALRFLTLNVPQNEHCPACANH